MFEFFTFIYILLGVVGIIRVLSEDITKGETLTNRLINLLISFVALGFSGHFLINWFNHF